MFIPMHLQDEYKIYVTNSTNTAEAYDIAFNALCAVRVMIAKECELAEIDEYIAEKQDIIWRIGLKNKINRVKKNEIKG